MKLVVPFITGMTFCIFSACNQNDSISGFRPTAPKQLTQNQGKDEDPTVVLAKDGKIYIAWFSDQDSNNEIWMTRSGNGVDWSTPWKIIAHPDEDLYPQLTQDNNGIFYLVWFRIGFDEGLQQYTWHVWFAKSTDALTWTDHKQLSEAASTFNWVPSISADQSGKLWVAYSSGRLDVNKEVYLIHSADGGQSWLGDAMGNPIRITQHNLSDDYPHIKQKKDGTYLLAWTRSDESQGAINPTAENIMSSSVDGLTWSSPQVISPPDPSTSFTDIFPHIFLTTDDEVEVAWTTDRTGNGGNIVRSTLIDANTNHYQIMTNNGKAYSGRIIPTSTPKVYFMIYVSTENELTKPDIFYQLIEF